MINENDLSGSISNVMDFNGWQKEAKIKVDTLYFTKVTQTLDLLYPLFDLAIGIIFEVQK